MVQGVIATLADRAESDGLGVNSNSPAILELGLFARM